MTELRIPISEHDHLIGSVDAPVTLVEYGDYQCPHCQAAWPQVELVLRQFGNGLCYAYRHFPIITAHPLAKPAAEAAEFAGRYDLFWGMHSAIYEHGHQLSGQLLLRLAAQLGLDATELRNTLEQGTFAAKVETDFLGGVRSGVNGTPCFFVNGERHDGAYDAMSLSAAIEAAGSQAPSSVVRVPVG
jgi:protein-disulfide isomerase